MLERIQNVLLRMREWFADEPVKTAKQTCSISDIPSKSYVTKAFFAKKVEDYRESIHKIKVGDTHENIEISNPGLSNISKIKEIFPDLSRRVGANIKLRFHSTSFEKVDSAVVGTKMWIIVETKDLRDANVSIEIRGSCNSTFVKPDEIVSLIANGAETNRINCIVGQFAKENNAPALIDSAVVEIEMAPRGEDNRDFWRKKIKESEERKGFLHLKVTATSNQEIVYNSEAGLEPTSKKYGLFLSQESDTFKVLPCYCENDLTELILKDLGTSLEKSREYLHALNETFNNFNIKTCLQKAHFLSQVIHESGGLRFTKEGVPDDAYGGYPGRGLMQITRKANYEAYGIREGVDFTSSQENKEQLESLPYSARSAGWYWDEFKNLNGYAAENDFIYITRIVNGGYNGFNDRLSILKKGFSKIYDYCTNDFDKSSSFIFENSRSYNDERGSFAWGLWHDPLLSWQVGLNFNPAPVGCSKDKDLAIEGYKRFIEIVAANFPETNWYNIAYCISFSEILIDGKVNVLKAAKKRLEILSP
jgi:predicted chitinase